jgi:hypothetical protein
MDKTTLECLLVFKHERELLNWQAVLQYDKPRQRDRIAVAV